MFKSLKKRLTKTKPEALAIPAWIGIDVAVVEQVIRPVTGGRIRYRGTTWRAFPKNHLTLNAGDIVRVSGRVGISFLVERYC